MPATYYSFIKGYLLVGIDTKRNPSKSLGRDRLIETTHEPWNIGTDYFEGVLDIRRKTFSLKKRGDWGD